jgi:hypothetical protein
MPHKQFSDERLGLRRRRLGACGLRPLRGDGGTEARATQPPLLKLAEHLNEQPEQQFDDCRHTSRGHMIPPHAATRMPRAEPAPVNARPRSDLRKDLRP